MLIGFASCEKDDICIFNPLTPKLVIGFYDQDNPETLKTVESLSIWVEGKERIYENASLSSIELPLNSFDTQTVYQLSKGTSIISTLTINYTPQEDYVSRSCGYRFIYNDLTLGSDASWISALNPTNLTVINSQTEHVQIFH
jgi:hypothetical protein